MGTNKVMLKQGVLSKGGGSRRVILDFESGVIYPYLNPERLIGMYQKGKGWILVDRPTYYSGGWGRPSTGDADGHHTLSNAKELIEAIDGTVYELNAKDFLTIPEMQKLNAAIEESNRIIQERKNIATTLGRNAAGDDLYPMETLEIKLQHKGKSAKGIDAVAVASKYANAVKVFTERKGQPVRVDSYWIGKDLITQDGSGKQKTVVAFRDANGVVYMNSQVLSISKFEDNFMGKQSLIQKSVREIAKYSIPFNVLASAGLKLEETRVLENGSEQDFELRNETRHFTGALLLENAGRKFFMDIDRIEIKNKLFNVFFVEVDSAVKSIAEAYESMKPQSVRDAEAAGIEVKRQGEWFFIATEHTVRVQTLNVFSGDWYVQRANVAPTQYVNKANVSHGKGRPNSLFRPFGFGELDTLVCGTVSHSGREHADLDLGQDEETSSGNGDFTTFRLWKLVPNTTVSNFTIEGEVD